MTRSGGCDDNSKCQNVAEHCSDQGERSGFDRAGLPPNI